ncbi:MAG: hypothetical protein KDA44_18080 [Planctomycetales bacterium]|nr:hypothetical protein [Planctomycetales bacterium]
MRRSRVETLRSFVLAGLCGTLALAAPQAARAHHTGEQHVHFQKPQHNAPAESTGGVTFRSLKQAEASVDTVEPAAAPAPRRAAPRTTAASPNPLRKSDSAQQQAAAAREKSVVQAAFDQPPAAESQPSQPRSAAREPSYVSDPAPTLQRVASAPQRTTVRRDSAVRTADGGSLAASFRRSRQVQPTTYLNDYCAGEPGCGIIEPGCGIMEPGCGIMEPGCGIMEPTCGCGEPSCGICEPGCGIMEPGCGIMEPTCGCGEPSCGICEPGCGLAEPVCGDCVECGSCVDGGSDYWCFPVCLPRLRELRIWGGVHGFKGPRDAPGFGGAGDGNFGFQEGINIAGRPPIIGRLLPGIAYQLGYQATQSQLSGNSDGSSASRSQDFVTAGLFRRVDSGLQFGAVWDYMSDDYLATTKLQQMRYEISLKSPRGREVGFRGTTHLNNATVTLPMAGDTTFEAVDQYVGFLRWNYRHGGNFRIWGGGTNDSEGIFGADVWFPATERWSVQTGFNYLIPDKTAGINGSREESWNLGINFYWHWDRTAKKNCGSMFQPLFNVADNGSFFVDEAP